MGKEKNLRFVKVDDMITELPENKLDEVFTIEFGASYQLEISKINGFYKVTNGINGYGNNCRKEFENSEVKILSESAPTREGGLQWQICPKCNGQGTVSKPPWLAGDITEWSASEMSYECDVCKGKKIIAPPESKTEGREGEQK